MNMIIVAETRSSILIVISLGLGRHRADRDRKEGGGRTQKGEVRLVGRVEGGGGRVTACMCVCVCGGFEDDGCKMRGAEVM